MLLKLFSDSQWSECQEYYTYCSCPVPTIENTSLCEEEAVDIYLNHSCDSYILQALKNTLLDCTAPKVALFFNTHSF